METEKLENMLELDMIVALVAEALSVSANEIKISCVPIDWESALSVINNSISSGGQKNEIQQKP